MAWLITMEAKLTLELQVKAVDWGKCSDLLQ